MGRSISKKRNAISKRNKIAGSALPHRTVLIFRQIGTTLFNCVLIFIFVSLAALALMLARSSLFTSDTVNDAAFKFALPLLVMYFVLRFIVSYDTDEALEEDESLPASMCGNLAGFVNQLAYLRPRQDQLVLSWILYAAGSLAIAYGLACSAALPVYLLIGVQFSPMRQVTFVSVLLLTGLALTSYAVLYRRSVAPDEKLTIVETAYAMTAKLITGLRKGWELATLGRSPKAFR